MGDSAIEWTNKVWNVVRGCAKVSAGCTHCYAMRQAARFSGCGMPYEGLTRRTSHGPEWTGSARFIPEKLHEPLHWRRPRRVFVNSMSDLFHEDLTNRQIAAVFGVMAASPQHTFQALTKRPQRMLKWFRWAAKWYDGLNTTEHLFDDETRKRIEAIWLERKLGETWPLPNVHLLVSVEDQATADERIPLLLQCPAAVRGVSLEPMLGRVDFRYLQPSDPPTEIDALAGTHGVLRPHGGTCDRLDWVIVGGESGPGARPCDVAWIRSVVEQCREAAVPVFVKQLGARPLVAGEDLARWPSSPGWIGRSSDPGSLSLRSRKGGDIEEWPADLRVRQLPEAPHE